MIGTLAAVALLWISLILHDHPSTAMSEQVLTFPLELPVVLLGLMLFRGWALVAGRTMLAAALVAIATLRGADLAAYAIFARPFNPAIDGELIPATVRLAAGTFGTPLTLLLCLLIVALIFALALAVWWATGQIAELAPTRRRSRRWLQPLFLAALVPLALELSGVAIPFSEARTTRFSIQHLQNAVAASEDLERLRIEAARDPYLGTPGARLLPALRGRDIMVIFVESYGRSALENPLYGPTVRARLTAGQEELSTSGLVARSAWLTAPTVGGQSWLAHGTFLSGLRIDSQARYGALVASPRLNLLSLAQRGGWQSVAIMPGITLVWPEAEYFGYDVVLAAKDLGYAGEPFNWVTMPDQYTLSAFERMVLDVTPRPPVIAEIALLSSHAPWTPIPPLIDWDEVGDGAIFSRWATTGESPEALWRDHDKVRAQYRAAIDYALETVFSFAARLGESAPLIVVLGDHQPAGFVSGQPAQQDVPAHVIGPPDLIRALDGWNWTAGLIPSEAAPAWPMEAFRDRFLAAFGSRP